MRGTTRRAGPIPNGGAVALLAEIEALRVTGVLRFEGPSDASGSRSRGELSLVAGALALDQPTDPDGGDPVERLLALREGHFEVIQRLPPLAVSQGDDTHRRGSLAVHAPPDLMRYCEDAGLTGTLQLTRVGRVVDMVYEAGELRSIRADGEEADDLREVFAWEEGRFDVTARDDAPSLVPEAEAPALPLEDDPDAREPTTQFVRPRRRDETGRQLLRVVEVALAEVVRSRDAVPARRRPEAAPKPAPALRPRPASMPPPPSRDRGDVTVRIAFHAPALPATLPPPGPPAPAPPLARTAPPRAEVAPAAAGSAGGTEGLRSAHDDARARERRHAAGIVALGVLLVGALTTGRCGGTPGGVDSALIGAPLPTVEGALVAGDGAEEHDRITMDTLRGHVVMLDFWASWCPPCRASIPILNRVHAAHAAEGLLSFGVNVEAELPPARIAGLHAALGSRLPCLHDARYEFQRAFGVASLPTLVIADRAGVVREVVVGVPDERWLDARVGELLH